jgi:uridine kinase
MSSKQQIQAVVDFLRTHPPRPVLLVAIDGHSAAGKSTLARTLQGALPQVTIMHTDDFYRPMPDADRARLDAASGYQHYYDWQRLEQDVLQPLAQGTRSRYRRYDWHQNALDGWTEVRPDGIVIVEGCYAARPEVRDYYHAIIVVETPVPLRAQRQRDRADASPAWIARWEAAEQYYLQRAAPQTYATFIVGGA